jgi:hypothetical protein
MELVVVRRVVSDPLLLLLRMIPGGTASAFE